MVLAECSNIAVAVISTIVLSGLSAYELGLCFLQLTYEKVVQQTLEAAEKQAEEA